MKLPHQISEVKNERLDDFLQHPERSLIRLSLPIILGMAMQVIYSIADMIFVGRLGGDAIAAVTFSGSFFFLMFSLSSVSVGAQALIAQRIGANDHGGVNNTAFHALLMGSALGIAFFFIGRAFTKEMLLLVGARDQTLALGTAYLQIIFIGSPFLFFSAFSRAILIGEGDTKTPVIIMISTTSLNILLDPIFIYSFGWGVPGAAWATLVAMLTSFAAYLYFLFIHRGSYISIKLRFFQPSGKVLRDILRIGIPASVNQMVMNVGSMFTHRIISIFGSHAVAGYGLGGRIDMLIILPFIGISTALLSLVGMYYGAGRGDLIERITLFAIKRTLFVAVLFGFLIFLLAGQILKIFTSDPLVIEIGKNYLRYIVFVYPMIAFGMNSGRTLQGLGLGMPSLVITSTRVLLVNVPLAYLFTRLFNMSIDSVWISILISACISTIISFFWLRSSLGTLPKQPPLPADDHLALKTSSLLNQR